MKTVLAVILCLMAGKTQAIGGGTGGAYECKVDPRGVMVCYPKPRGF